MPRRPGDPPLLPALSDGAIADILYAAGFRSEALSHGISIVLRESGGGYPNARNWNTNGTVDRGLWQWNSGAWPAISAEMADDPARATAKAYQVSRGGTNWQAWKSSAGNTSFEGRAQAAAAGVNARGGALTPAASASAAVQGPPDPNVPGGGLGATSADVGLPPPGQLLASAYVAPLSTKYIVLEGFGEGKDHTEIDLSARVTGGEMSMSVEQVSQLTLNLIDTDRRLGRKGLLRNGAPLTWSRPGMTRGPNDREVLPWNGQVAAHEIDGEDPLSWKITSRSITSQLLRHGDLFAAASIKNASLSEYGAQLAKAVGSDFTGQGLPRLADIAPDTSATKPESAWDVLQRVAGDEGVWAWEADGHLYIGRPSWLIDRLVTIPVTVETGRITDCIGLPKPRESIDAPGGATTLDLNLPRWRGELVRPGMTLAMTWPDWLSNYPDRFLVSSVSWPVDGGLAPVAVSCVEPVDPPVKQAVGAPDNTPETAPGAPVTVPDTGSRPSSASSAGLIWPLAGSISSPFGPRGGRLHAGIDIACPNNTPVKAATAGKITRVSFEPTGYGNWVELARDADGLVTRYGHLAKAAVQVGDPVSQGQVIAYSNNTGHSSGPHLHFETRPGGAPVDPMTYLPKL